ncbi:MAG TPA: lamin tail domain-containing protein [Gemmatimonadaceae bacterium]|jgi:competence protein ComEC|nr:lamin tail domain-containing protein [Gemmatimonadaceae bacterium]
MRRLAAFLLLVALVACRGRGGEPRATGRDLVVTRAMIDPTAVPDDRGEWIEIANVGTTAADLDGWRLTSANDVGFVFGRSLVVPPGGRVLIARDARARDDRGARPAIVYSGIILGNNYDWLALRDATGATRDSVSWEMPERGKPMTFRTTRAAASDSMAANGDPAQVFAPPRDARETVVNVLDVGQGDAILVRNGGSTVLIDGGPDRRALARWLDRFGVRDTIDAVILTHQHSDHYEGLRELFSSRRGLVVRRFWSNGDSAPNMSFTGLPDSIEARARSGRTIVRDSDDPCGNGAALCTLSLRGGAKLHVLRAMPNGSGQNNRSTAVKLVGADSGSFTMWIGGDAQRQEISWFAGAAGYGQSPGMRADVLKADHHGSCDGMSDRYLDVVHPSLVVASLAAANDYGHMHAQTKSMLVKHGVPWYRTDQNGTVTLRSAGTPGGGYTVHAERGAANANGPSDRASHDAECSRM